MSSDLELSLKLVSQQPWGMQVQALEALVEAVRLRARGLIEVKADLFDDQLDGAAVDKGAKQGGIGVIPIRGTLKQHSGGSFWDFLFGGTSYDGISAALKAFLADESVRAIVFDIDSPGGSTYGVSELANEVMAARGKKPILAIANSLAASAACHVGAVCDRFYGTPGGTVGSIGVYWMHQDISKMADEMGLKVTFVSAGENKLRGNEFEELSEEDLAHFQEIVDERYDFMVKDIARGRGVSTATVRTSYGKGDALTSTQAKKAGLIDGIKTLGEVIAEAQTARPRGLRAVTSAEGIDVNTEDTETPEEETDSEGQARLARMRLRDFKARAAAVAV